MDLTLGQKIAQARKLKDLTQMQLAAKLGVSSEAVSKWEKDVYLPSKENQDRLFELLDIPYTETEAVSNARLYDEVHMSAFLKGKLNSGDFPEAARALKYAKEKHKGQTRKGPGEVPYINHPLTMACQAFAMGLEDDILLAAVFLHDVVEDCGVTADELPVCREVREIVTLLTGTKKPEKLYYQDIAANPKACLVKCLDRCNNLSTMATAFSDTHIREYAEETKRYYPELLRVIKNCPEYNNAAWLLNYHIRSLLLMAERIK